MVRRVDGRGGVHTKVQGINRTPSTVTQARRTTKKTPTTTSWSLPKSLPTFAPIPFDSRAEESDNSEGGSTKSSTKRGEGSAKRFACPFFKNDPIKYGTQDRRRCAGTGWPDISRLKEHLTRSHTSKTYCPRCYEEFPDLQGLYEHSAADCEPRPGRPPDGITPDIARKLRSRKKPTPLQSDHDKWVEIYRILFPSRRHVPSPYFEPPQGKVLVHLDGQKEYMRQEVRRLIESRLELKDGASDKGELLKIVDECQDEAFNKYRILSGFDFHDDEGVYTTSDRTPTTQVPHIPLGLQALSWNDEPTSGLQPVDEMTTPRTCTCGNSSVCTCGTSAAGGETLRNLWVMPEHNGASMVEHGLLGRDITEWGTPDWDDWPALELKYTSL